MFWDNYHDGMCGSALLQPWRAAAAAPSGHNTYQHVHAVDGYGADQLQAHDAHQKARVLDGVRHGQDPRADVALQKVDQRFAAPAESAPSLVTILPHG